MFMNGKNGYFIRCTFMNALNVDYSPDFFISVGMIYDEEMAKVSMSTSALAMFPTNHEICTCTSPLLPVDSMSICLDQGLAKARRRNLPVRPDSCLFTLPDQFKSTIEGKRFILLVETPIRRERLLLFTSDNQLDLLFDSHTVFMDGTFSRSPPHFKQIFILHAIHVDICKN